MPLLDGSAREWVEAIEESGISIASDVTGAQVGRDALVVDRPITVNHGDSFVAAFPAPTTRLSYGIDFPHVKLLLPSFSTHPHTWHRFSFAFGFVNGTCHCWALLQCKAKSLHLRGFDVLSQKQEINLFHERWFLVPYSCLYTTLDNFRWSLKSSIVRRLLGSLMQFQRS